MVIIELEQEVRGGCWEDSPIRKSIEALQIARPDLVNDTKEGIMDFDAEYERQYRCRIIYRDEMKTALNSCIVWEDRDFTYFRIKCP